ncbi:MAG: four helix bundle protein [Chthoniobacteraceae bacterium]
MKDEEDGGGTIEDLRKRTKRFALRAITLFVALPRTPEAQILGKQFLRSATSAGAHYREAKRAKSDADFISKIEGGLQELEEAQYWLELLAESGIVTPTRLKAILAESEELIAIFVSIVKKAKTS